MSRPLKCRDFVEISGGPLAGVGPLEHAIDEEG